MYIVPCVSPGYSKYSENYEFAGGWILYIYIIQPTANS